jgi:Ca2+/H+ antiporter
VATLVGLLPGTAAVVILGDALTGNVNPLLVLISVCTAAVGAAGLVYEVRSHRHAHGTDPETDADTDREPEQADVGTVSGSPAGP